jgi:ElaB/YqjD/DUF883 family membrane-anchored ribosome-binding protein
MEKTRPQIHKGRQVLTDLAETVIEKTPDVVETALEELRRDAPQAIEQVRDFVEHLVAGTQDRLASQSSANTTLSKLADHGDALVKQLPGIDGVRQHASSSLQQAKDLTDQAQQRMGQTPASKSVGHTWRRGAIFLVLGLGVGAILNRLLRAKQRAAGQQELWVTEGQEPSPSFWPVNEAGADTAYHTSVLDSDGDGGVYHDQQDCPAGRRIKSENRVSGTDGRTRCKDCEMIAS